MRKRCTRDDWIRMTPAEREKLINDFLALIREKYPNSEFGYESFPELDYEEMAFSTLFAYLKDWGYIESVGPLTFKLVRSDDQDVPATDVNDSSGVAEKVEQLITKLKDYSPPFYFEYKDIIDEIVKIGEPAVPILISKLRKNCAIPHILALIGDSRALEPLINLAQRPGNFEDNPEPGHSWYAAEEAIHALGLLGDARALPFLNDLLRKTNIAELSMAASKAKEQIELKQSEFKLPKELEGKNIDELQKLAESESTSPEFLDALANHPSWHIRARVAKNPKTPVETLRRLSKKTGDPAAPISEINVHYQLTKNPNCPPDVLAFIEKCSIGIAGDLARKHPNYKATVEETKQPESSHFEKSSESAIKEYGQLAHLTTSDDITLALELQRSSQQVLEKLVSDDITLALEPFLPRKYRKKIRRKKRRTTPNVHVARFSIAAGLFMIYLGVIWLLLANGTTDLPDLVKGPVIWITSVLGVDASSTFAGLYSLTYGILVFAFGLGFLGPEDSWITSISVCLRCIDCIGFFVVMWIILVPAALSPEESILHSIILFVIVIITLCYPQETIATKTGSVIAILYNFPGKINAANRKRFVLEKLVAQLKQRGEKILEPVQILAFRKAIPYLKEFIQTHDFDSDAIELPSKLRDSLKTVIYELGALAGLEEFEFGLFKYDLAFGLYLWKNLEETKEKEGE